MVKRVRAHVNPLSIIHEHELFEGFGNENPLFVDVGAYKGEFMAQLGEKFPKANFILFEIRKPIALDLEKQFVGRDNFKVFDGDAGLNFKSILYPSIKKGVKIEKVFVNFPDPWFKDKHKKRRFITTKFLNSIANWWPKETVFVFQTDQEFLFNETKEAIEASSFSDITLFDDSAYGIPTDWEQAKLALGNPIWRMEFRLI